MMGRSKHWRTVFLLVLWIGSRDSVGSEHDVTPGDRLFGGRVLRFHLALSAEQFAALNPAGGGRPGFPGFGPPQPAPEGTHRNTFGVNFPWSQGELTCEGETFPDVGLRYKGNYTFMASAASLKKPLKVDLNRNVKGQKLDGLTLLNLNSGVSDPTQVREALSYAFFRDAGVPAPRTAFAELTLTVPGKFDDEFVGVYTLVEQVNKAFLNRQFADATGMLLKPEGLQGGLAYRGTDWKEYEFLYHPERRPTSAQQQRLFEFTKLIERGTDQEFARDVGDFLELDDFLKFIAANALLANLDSYLGFGHNYYLYLVPSTGKFVFIPWDLDLSLATWPAAGSPEQLVTLSIHHPHAGENKLIDRLFAIPEHKERYLEIIGNLCATSFSREGWLARLDQLEKSLKGPLAREAKAVAARREGRGRSGQFGTGFGGGQYGQSLPPRKFISLRTESVAAQLAGESRGFEPRPLGAGFGRPR